VLFCFVKSLLFDGRYYFHTLLSKMFSRFRSQSQLTALQQVKETAIHILNLTVSNLKFKKSEPAKYFEWGAEINLGGHCPQCPPLAADVSNHSMERRSVNSSSKRNCSRLQVRREQSFEGAFTKAIQLQRAGRKLLRLAHGSCS